MIGVKPLRTTFCRRAATPAPAHPAGVGSAAVAAALIFYNRSGSGASDATLKAGSSRKRVAGAGQEREGNHR
jgi:hypothetical protein